MKALTLDFEPIKRLLETYEIPIVPHQSKFRENSLSRGMKEYLKMSAQISFEGNF